jgi:hypothetical protein
MNSELFGDLQVSFSIRAYAKPTELTNGEMAKRKVRYELFEKIIRDNRRG